MFKHDLAPLCQNFRNCTFQKCQFSHTQNDNESYSAIENLEEVVPTVDNESDSDSYPFDDESNQAETSTKSINANPVRCDYGLCDFQQILFKTKSDPKTHLRNHHGIGIEQ